MSAAPVASTRLANPFPGLRPFHESEQYLFFGRESQIDTMIDKLSATRFLAVLGTSGSGKSSLVNCGLKPALRRGLMSSAGTAWRMAHFRPGSDPIKAMADALVQPDGLFPKAHMEGMSVEEIVEATLRMSKLGLVDAYEQAPFDEPPKLLVIVDQFEELFRYRNLQASTDGKQGTEEKAVAFVNLLLEAAVSHHPIYVVLTMRSDFLGDCAQFFGLPEAINRGQYLVPRMSRDERRAAIAGPVAVNGGKISPVLLTRLVNDVGDNPDQLSILQHALNRTWAEWQRQGGTGSMDLQHYEAIGTMAHALDYHAEEAYAELPNDEQKAICEKLFQAITDKGTDARGIRRPTTAGTLSAIAGVSIEEMTSVLAAFREPSRSFVMPPVPEPITPDTVIDISHESLMRVWNRLKTWVEDEAESASQYQRLVQNAALHARGTAALMTDPELSTMLDWQQKRRPNAAWGERYRPGFESAIAFLDESRKARDAAVEAEKERQRRELRRTRQIAAVLGTAFVLAVGFGIYAMYEKRKAEKADALAVVKTKLAEEQTNSANEQKRAKEKETALNHDLTVALGDATKARAEAEKANKQAQEMARNFVEASKESRKAENWQLEKAERLQEDQDPNTLASASVIKRDEEELKAADAQADKWKLDAARKTAEAVAFLAKAKIVSPRLISGSDSFEKAELTDCSGGCAKGPDGKVSAPPAPACNLKAPSACNFCQQPFTRNPGDMLRRSDGSTCGATVFEDGKPVGFKHYIAWKTRNPVTVNSVGLFAAHDLVRYHRSFETFELYVKNNRGQWTFVQRYEPSLMYGGSCDAKWCHPPPPTKPYDPGTVLAVCINVPPTTGQEFKAVFVQSTSSVEKLSGPRVLQLDGYPKENCAN